MTINKVIKRDGSVVPYNRLRITNAMQQYKAIHGAYPKTEEVFFKEIIDAGGITLPDLPAGQKFGYAPELAAETSAEQSLTILKPK